MCEAGLRVHMCESCAGLHATQHMVVIVAVVGEAAVASIAVVAPAAAEQKRMI